MADKDELPFRVRHFSSLPDEMIMPTDETAVVVNLSGRSVRYHPDLPRQYVSERHYGQRVRDIRKLLREGPSKKCNTRTDRVDDAGAGRRLIREGAPPDRRRTRAPAQAQANSEIPPPADRVATGEGSPNLRAEQKEIK